MKRRCQWITDFKVPCGEALRWERGPYCPRHKRDYEAIARDSVERVLEARRAFAELRKRKFGAGD